MSKEQQSHEGESAYVFKSEITKSCLPFGVTRADQVARSEVSAVLGRIKDKAKKEFASWGDLFVTGRVERWDCWSVEGIARFMRQLQSDIECLTDILIVQNFEPAKDTTHADK